MPNRGLNPIDANSSTGKMRYLVGDTDGVPLDPAEAGWLSYSVWSDAALDSALVTADGNPLRAASNLYFGLAAEYAQRGRSIKTDDLSLDTSKRSSDLISIARAWLEQAVAGEAGADFFQLVPFNGAVDPDPFWPVTASRTAVELDGSAY